MKFRSNPWIDPRVLLVKPADAEAYLLKRGWIRVECEAPNKHAFANSPDENEASVVCVAQRDQASDYPLRIVELIGDLAKIEDRYAVEVLNDVLQAKNAPVPANGPSSPRVAEGAAS